MQRIIDCLLRVLHTPCLSNIGLSDRKVEAHDDKVELSIVRPTPVKMMRYRLSCNMMEGVSPQSVQIWIDNKVKKIGVFRP